MSEPENDVISVISTINVLQTRCDEMSLKISELDTLMKEKDETINWLLTEVERIKQINASTPVVDENKKMKADILLSMLSMQQQKLKEEEALATEPLQVIDADVIIPQTTEQKSKEHKHRHRTEEEKRDRKNRKMEEERVNNASSTAPQSNDFTIQKDENRVVPKRKNQFICKR